MIVELLDNTKKAEQSLQGLAGRRPSARARTECTNLVVEGSDSGLRLTLSGPAVGGGPGAAELLLGALAAEAAMIKETIAPRLGVQLYAVRSKASCGPDGPDFQDIHLEIEIESSAGERAVQEVLKAWRERSPVYLSLSRLEIQEKVTVIDPYECP